jgi:phage terminase large subunit-like protein
VPRGGRRHGSGRKGAAKLPDIRDFVSPVIGKSPRLLAERGEPVDVLTSGPHFEKFCGECLSHTRGPIAGASFLFEEYLQRFWNEALEFDEQGRRRWRRVTLGIARKNAKTMACAAFGLYMLSDADGEVGPEVVLGSGSLRQADNVFRQASEFIQASAVLREWMVPLQAEIRCEARNGRIVKVAANEGAHGLGPSLCVIDELHTFSAPSQIESYRALTTGQGGRAEPLVIVISTAGASDDSLLGTIYRNAQADEEIERDGGLTVARNHEAKRLTYWYESPAGISLSDVAGFKLANPGSWRTVERLAEDLADDGLDEATKRRFYGNQWVSAQGIWIGVDKWSACRDDTAEIPDGAEVFVGVDASFSGDATAVSWAHRLGDNRIVLRCHVWSALATTAAHTQLTGGRIDYAAVEDFILGLGRRYRIREVVYDPSYFARSAELLDERGLTVASIDQRSKAMRQATDQFYEAVGSRQVAHDGDLVFASHVTAAAATLDEFGSWRVKKARQDRKIDGLIAAVIAHSRAARDDGPSIYERRGILTVDVDAAPRVREDELETVERAWVEVDGERVPIRR